MYYLLNTTIWLNKYKTPVFSVESYKSDNISELQAIIHDKFLAKQICGTVVQLNNSRRLKRGRWWRTPIEDINQLPSTSRTEIGVFKDMWYIVSDEDTKTSDQYVWYPRSLLRKHYSDTVIGGPPEKFFPYTMTQVSNDIENPNWLSISNLERKFTYEQSYHSSQ